MSTTTAPTRYARMWHLWKLGERRIIRTLTIYQIHSQCGKMRTKHRECAGWRWKTRTLSDGSVEVWRVE